MEFHVKAKHLAVLEDHTPSITTVTRAQQYRVSNRSAGMISSRCPGVSRRHFDQN